MYHNILFQRYADDTQLYLSMKPDDTHSFVKLQECLKNIKVWMTSSFQLLSSDKAEVIVLIPDNLRNRVSNQILSLDDITLSIRNTGKNLGVTFDQDMSFYAHTKQICRTAFLHVHITSLKPPETTLQSVR